MTSGKRLGEETWCFSEDLQTTLVGLSRKLLWGGDGIVYWIQQSGYCYSGWRVEHWRATFILTLIESAEIQTWQVNQGAVSLLKVYLHEKLRTLPGQSGSWRHFWHRKKKISYKWADVLLNIAEILCPDLTFSSARVLKSRFGRQGSRVHAFPCNRVLDE